MSSNHGAGYRVMRALRADPQRTDAETARLTGTNHNTVARWRHRLEAQGVIGPIPKTSRTRNPGAGTRARLALVTDPRRGNTEIARVARCTPNTAYVARRELEREGAIPVHACGDPKPPPCSRPSRTREAIAKLGLDAAPRQIADEAGVSIQMAWKALRDERAAQAAAEARRAGEARQAGQPVCAHCGGAYEPHEYANGRQRFCSDACQRDDYNARKRAEYAGRALARRDVRSLPRVSGIPQPEALSRGLCATCPPGQRHLWTSEDHAERQAARAICRTCPVLDICREYALSLPAFHDSAVFAGLTGAERAAAKRAAQAANPLASAS